MFVYEGIYIRAIEEKDLPFLAECRNDPSTWFYLGTIDFTNNIKQLDWWKSFSLDKSKANFIFCQPDGIRIGFVRMDEIDHVNKSIRIGADIIPAFRNQGFGTRLYNLLLRYCFNELNMHRVWLLVLDFNDAAINLYSKMGFRLEGSQREAIYRNGKYHNYLMMSVLRNEWQKD